MLFYCSVLVPLGYDLPECLLVFPISPYGREGKAGWVWTEKNALGPQLKALGRSFPWTADVCCGQRQGHTVVPHCPGCFTCSRLPTVHLGLKILFGKLQE